MHLKKNSDSFWKLLVRFFLYFIDCLRGRKPFLKSSFYPIVENLQDIVYVRDLQGRFEYINNAVKSLLGYQPQDCLKKSGQSFLSNNPINRQTYRVASKQIKTSRYHSKNNSSLRTEQAPAVYNVEVIGSKNRRIILEVHETLIFSKYDKPKVYGIAIDVNLSAQAEKRILQLNSYLQNLLDSIPLAIWGLDKDSEIVYCNQSAEKFYNVDRNRIYGKPLGKIVPSFAEEDQLRLIQEVLTTGKGNRLSRWLHIINHQAVAPQAKEIFADIFYSPIMNAAGEVLGLNLIVEDTSDMAKLETEIKESEARYRSFLENASDAIFVLDPRQHKFIEVNDRAVEMSGYTKVELLSLELNQLQPQKATSSATAFDPPNFRMLRKILSGEIQKFEAPIKRKDGKVIAVGIGFKAVYSLGKKYYLGIARDMTERVELENQLKESLNQLKLAQAELIQAAKMTAVGQLASGVAHELNNPLAAILTYSQILLQNIKNKRIEPQQVAKTVEHIQEIVRRSKTTIKNLLDFSRQTQQPQNGETPLREMLNLKEIIEKLLSFTEYQLALQNIVVTRHYGKEIPEVLGEAGLLQQVFLNLLNNASDAIVRKGSGKLSGAMYDRSTTPQYQGEIKIELYQHGNMVQVKFSDNGMGISSEHIDKIFEPFFTTKEVGKGTGLGLSLSYSIIKSHNGHITVESQYGYGTTITIWLPITQAKKKKESPEN